MRLRLVGFSGTRPPVPGTEVVSPEDPEPQPETPPDEIPPPLLLVLNNGDTFHKAAYLALGYNRFDVMCIGAAGGHAGTVKQTIPDSGVHKYNVPLDYDLYWDSYRYLFGGAGGGGGAHRVKGRLALLPTNVPIVVGQPGADGAPQDVHSPFHDWRTGNSYPPAPLPNSGGDGGASSFGGTICRASGGKGANGLTGGPGGKGNTDVAGGGPAPAYSGSVNTTPGDPGGIVPGHLNPGAWDGKIGSGGAGGNGTSMRGFAGEYGSGGTNILDAVRGADGAYSSADPSISGKGAPGVGFGFDFTRVVPEFIYPTDGQNPYASGYNILIPAHYDVGGANPGAGGGATAFPLTGSLTQYGSKAGGLDGKGAVIIRLTYAIV